MFGLIGVCRKLPGLFTAFAANNGLLLRCQHEAVRSYSILSSLPAPRMLAPAGVEPCVEAGAAGGVTIQQVRLRETYRINVHKRLKKHGLKTRLSTRKGIAILWRRFLKGRQSLST